MDIENIDQELLKQAYQTIKGVNIPSIPETLLSLQRELNSQEPDREKIIQLIGEDISLSGKIIKNINSAAFGLRAKVSSIEHATVILGIRNLRDMIVSTALSRALEDSLPGFIDIAGYSNKVGFAAQIIASESGLAEPDNAFIAGLFHLSGTMILMQKYDNYLSVFNQYRQQPETLSQQEIELFGSTYPMISFILAYQWKLPEIVAQAIAFHQMEITTVSNSEVRPIVAALQIATHLVDSLKNDASVTEPVVSRIEIAMHEININPESLQEVTDKIAEL